MCSRAGEHAGRRPTGAPGSRSFRCFGRAIAGAGGMFGVLVLAAECIERGCGSVCGSFRLCTSRCQCRRSSNLHPLDSGGGGYRLCFGCRGRYHHFGSAYGRHRTKRHLRRSFQIESPALRTDGSYAVPARRLHALRTDSSCTAAAHLRALGSAGGGGDRLCFGCRGRHHHFGPACGRHGAQRPPRQSFQIQFDAAGGAVEHAAPAEHLHRLGAALHAAAWSARRTTAPAAAKLRAVIAPRVRGAAGWAKAPTSSSSPASLLHCQRSFDQLRSSRASRQVAFELSAKRSHFALPSSGPLSAHSFQATARGRGKLLAFDIAMEIRDPCLLKSARKIISSADKPAPVALVGRRHCR